MNREMKSKETMQELKITQNKLANTFQEFIEIKNNFIYGEVWNQGELDNKLRSLVTITALVVVEGNDLEEQIHVALHLGVTVSELQEIFHQVVPYIGFAKSERGLSILAEVCEKQQMILPIMNVTVTEEKRLEKGLRLKKQFLAK